jgi:hypothetical protein
MENKNPFEKRALKSQNLFQRLARIKPRENAIAELNNLLARSKNMRDIVLESIDVIASEYKVDFEKKFVTELKELYRTYVKCCLQNEDISDEEVEDLSYLRLLLHIGDDAGNEIYEYEAGLIYKQNVEKAIADGSLSEDEKQLLDRLRNRLRLTENITDTIRNESIQIYLQRRFDAALDDQRFTPQEEAELNTIAENLGANLIMDDNTTQALRKYRLYWQIENGEVPVIDVDINLQKTEKCYFTTEIGWHEYRRSIKRIRYGGPVARIKITKGLYFRAADYAIKPITNDVLTLIDSGQLFLTNKRLIFMGDKKNSSIKLNKILDFATYRNGVDIKKDSGKSPFLEFGDNVDIFSMTLARAIKDLHN